MKKSTISKLKSIFGSKKGKRQHQLKQSAKSSRSPSPDPVGETSPSDDDFRPLISTPPPSRTNIPPSPPVPTHPKAPVTPEPLIPLPLVPCQVCGRTFVPASLAKHVKICEKMTIKKRKMFDSSRQRREGTDLEQYLPKNFGLPENSPFLEKSPPHTAKPAPKPKVQCVRSTILKSTAELQKCPHCNRAFGVRAFERHVEWCGDKAKILPAAPAQPPPHIADAKQRLNARTKYKAPIRGRKSSQTRDKSSNSRSASVESSRGVSPPREFGNHKHSRSHRASESASSNDCHEDTSLHVPVIRNARNSLGNSSGDANLKARQARLARDLSSTRTNDSRPSSVQQSNTDPNIRSTENQTKQRKILNVKKQHQLKKLEEIALKYNERNKEKQEETKSFLKKREKSLIPIPKKNSTKKASEQDEDRNDSVENTETVAEDIKECVLIQNNVNELLIDKKKNTIVDETFKERSSKSKVDKLKTARRTQATPREIKVIKVVKSESDKKEKKSKPKYKVTKKINKESTMSLDSLEEPDNERKSQSIGINTELLCVPCVIHDNLDQKNSGRKPKNKQKPKCLDLDKIEPKIELLYKNPTITNSCDTRIREKTDSKENLSIFNSLTIITTSSSDLVADNTDINLTFKVEDEHEGQNKPSEIIINTFSNDGNDYRKSNQIVKSEEENELSVEIFEENDVSNDDIHNYSIEHRSDNEDNHNDIECRYGSGETYTKFTEDPADLDEFMNLTDKMMIIHNFEGERFEIDKSMNEIHTPKTNSLEAITKNDDNIKEESKKAKYSFSDTFAELKNDLKVLLDTAGDDVKESLQKPNNVQQNNNTDEDARKICDMEHITVYQLKFYDQKSMLEKKASLEVIDTPKELRLPSIDENNKVEATLSCNKKRMQSIYKINRKYKMLAEQKRSTSENQTFIMLSDDNSDSQSISSEAPPLKLPRIENKKSRLDDNYDPFVSAARQMKELMSSDTNVPKKLSTSSKDLSRTLPVLRTSKEKGLTSLNNNTKMMKDTLNKSYQKTPTLQRMKSFGSTNNDNNNSFGGRCSSFRVNRSDNKKSSQKLNTTFTKSSKENISTMDKSYFNRNSNLNRSFSSYTASSYSTPKPKDKIPKIATSLYHSFQRTTINQPVKLDKIKREDEKKNFVNLDTILADDNSSMTDSSYIDPRLINENDNLPINVNTILNNPDIISSMESLQTTENLPAKFESFSSNNNLNNNIKNRNGITNSNHKIEMLENNNNINKITVPIVDDLNDQYNKIMSSLEQSITSKTSVRDDESLCEDFDLEDFMTSFDEEIIKHKLENKRTCSSTTRVVKQSEIADSNQSSKFSSVSSTPKIANGMIPVNKSMSLNFSSNSIVNENLFPSSVKRSTSLLDSIQKKSVSKVETSRTRHKTDQLEQDLMQSLKDFDKFYASEKNETNHSNREAMKYNSTSHNGTAKRDTRLKSDRKTKKDENVLNGSHYSSNGKSSNDSAYSSLNRISPSKLSLCKTKDSNGVPSLEQIPAESESSSHKDEGRYRSEESSSEEYLAMERSAELDEPLPKPDLHPPFKELENHTVQEKRISSRASSRRSPPTWRAGELSSSGSEVSLHRSRRGSAPAPRLSRFCHECGTKFSVDTAKFCVECGVKRLAV